jgi:archaellum component FlaC
MGVKSEIEEFQSMINRIVESLEEVSSSSAAIPEKAMDELSNKISSLSEGCEEVSSELITAIEMLEGIKSRWG